MPKNRTNEISLISGKSSRLYSKFPVGSVGLALFLLRLVDGLGLVGEGVRLFTPAITSSEPISLLLLGLGLVSSAILLILGLRTSFAGSVAAICIAAAAAHNKHDFVLQGSELYAWSLLFSFVFFLSVSLALMGPGGYSLDARLSGWRMITLSPRQLNEQGESNHVDR
jgi:uncharacterized membrane protein YphA (DoxX/SURF4 family)